ncbi:MAG: biotin/lipoyl-containing protein [Nanoarchaeota archaeon]
MEDIIVTLDGKDYKVKVEENSEGKIKVHLNGKSYDVETKADIEKEIIWAGVKKSSQEGKSAVVAPLPGTVVSINIKVGDVVKEGDSLLKLVAMKMENDIVAQKNGVVKEIRVKKNESVNKDDVLVVID